MLLKGSFTQSALNPTQPYTQPIQLEQWEAGFTIPPETTSTAWAEENADCRLGPSQGCRVAGAQSPDMSAYEMLFLYKKHPWGDPS
jgi:hypothetical protein